MTKTGTTRMTSWVALPCAMAARRRQDQDGPLLSSLRPFPKRTDAKGALTGIQGIWEPSIFLQTG